MNAAEIQSWRHKIAGAGTYVYPVPHHVLIDLLGQAEREIALRNLVNADWCARCGGTGNGPTQYDGGSCPGCEGAGLVPRATTTGGTDG